MIEIKNYLKEKNFEFMPTNYGASKYYTITLEGFSFLTLDKDSDFSLALNLAAKNIDTIIKYLKKTHVFTEPFFCIKNESTVYIKIGICEKKLFNKKNN